MTLSRVLACVASGLLAAVAPVAAADVRPAPASVQRPTSDTTAPTGSAAAALVGAWRLVRYVDTPDGGAPVQAFGARPIGQFVFSADGRVATDACVPEWYCSYFGIWRIAPDAGRWTVHVLGGNIPSFIGTDQSRNSRIDGDRLILTDSYEADGRTVHAERVLERVR